MRWKFFLLFIAILLIISVGAKEESGSKVVDEFEDGDGSKSVEDDEEEFYINFPKDSDVTLVSARLDVKGVDAEDIRIKIDGNVLFKNDSLDSSIENINLLNNVTTGDCDRICRWKLEVRCDEGEVTVKNLLINYTYDETPLFIRYMDDVEWSGGSKNDVFDLDDYFYGSGVKYKNRTSKTGGLDHINVKIDSSNEVTFIAEAGWHGTGYVYFVADDNEDNAKSNEIKLIVGTGIEKPYQFSPINTTIVLMKGSQQIFGVSGSGNFSVNWYLNNNLSKSNSYTYVFDANKIGVYNLEARIGSTKRIWIISVLEPDIVSPRLVNVSEKKESVCGNGVREEGEDCSNCPDDVKCVSNARCEVGRCVLIEKEGFGGLIWILIIFGLVIVLVVVGMVLVKKDKLKLPNIFNKIFKKKEKVEEVKKELVEKKEDLSSLRNYLSENLKKGFKKEDLIKAAMGQGWKREQIDKILSEQTIPVRREKLSDELEPLEKYIKDSIRKGFKKEDLINAAMKIGWKREQIDKVLERI